MVFQNVTPPPSTSTIISIGVVVSKIISTVCCAGWRCKQELLIIQAGRSRSWNDHATRWTVATLYPIATPLLLKRELSTVYVGCTEAQLIGLDNVLESMVCSHKIY